MSRRPALIFCLANLFGAVVPSPGADALRTVAEARALSFAEAAAGRTVELAGVVTYLRDIPTDLNFSIHDGTGGIMVYPKERQAVSPGQKVKVRGITAMSVHGLRLTQATFECGTLQPLPAPVRASMAEVLEGRFEGEFAEMDGMLRAVRIESPEVKPQRLVFNFGSRSRRLSVWISQYAEGYDWIQPGATLRVRGVVMRWKNPRGQTQNINVLTNSLSDLQVLTEPAPPAVLSIAEALSWEGGDNSADRIQVAGQITYRDPRGTYLVIQAGRHAIRVRPEGTVEQGLEVGAAVAVTGFPTLGEYTTELEDAQVAPGAAGQLIAPDDYAEASAVLRPEGLVDRDARLISVEGIWQSIKERDDGLRVLEVQSGAQSFSATLGGSSPLPAGLRPGSRLRLTGVCSLHLTAERRRINRLPDAFSLALRDASDLTVLHAGPWWTRQRLQSALGIGGAGVLVLAVWIAVLRSSNGRLRREVEARERAERLLGEERQRVAAELHDTLEQTLTAASLQLSAATRLVPATPAAAASTMSLAAQLIARSRQEVRDAVWDLRLEQSAEAKLSEVLARLCAESSAETLVRFSTQGEEEALPAHQVAQVVRLVREAITNALKHGAPTRLEVACTFETERFTLTVVDDGRGFDPASASGAETGHFGLLGLQERSQRLGGQLEISSQPGSGTQVRIVIPKVSAPR